jgi:hypothetical protein
MADQQTRRAVFHVVFADGWQIKEEGRATHEGPYQTKEDAISVAKGRARSTYLGQVIIHKQDNSIETEYTYGEDPRDIPG